jgi:hypothetical protein
MEKEMYTPYFRGRQHELLALQKSSILLKDRQIMPIVEPMALTTGLSRTINYFQVLHIPMVLIVNPKCGKLQQREGIERLASHHPKCIFGYILDRKSSQAEINSFFKKFSTKNVALLHFDVVNNLPDLINLCKNHKNELYQIFIESTSVSRIYMEKFSVFERIWIEDGFNRDKVKNADFEEIDYFSNLLFEHKNKGFIGFGDFSIVGNKADVTGFRAHAVAIHITHLASELGQGIFCSHFKSDDVKGPENTEEKFLQAVTKLATISKKSKNIMETQALKEYCDLQARGHFPGLGVLKQLSIRHHLEFMSKLVN